MRTIKVIKNTIAGGVGTLLVGVLQFVGRMVFIRFLSDEYLGISSLFTNILSILSLAELGLGTAICFSLYKPLAGADHEKIKSIMHFFRKIYFMIGWIVMGVGIVLIPFLPYLMNGTTELVDVNLIFLLYVLQSASSYWFWAYKSILLQADQKMYLTKLYSVAATVVVTVVQLITLALFRNFLLYSAIGLMANILTNLLVAHSVNRLYPYLKDKDYIPLDKMERHTIFRDVFGMSMFKINTTVVNSTDNIVISSFINVTTVAFYGNYQIVISGISQVAMQIFGGVTATVGNLFAEDSEDKNEFIFRCLQLLCYWFYSFVGIGILIFINPVIQVSFGKNRLLADSVVFLQVLYFMINGFQRTSFIYRDACGLFWKGKARPIATAVLNIVISVTLVRAIGLAGVIWGTILSWLLTTWWYDPKMIYENAFHKSSFTYFVQYGKAAFVTVCSCVVTFWLSQLVQLPGALQYVYRLALCFIIPNAAYLLVYHRTEEYLYLKGMGGKLVRKIIHRDHR